MYVQPEIPTLEGLDAIIDTNREAIFSCTVERIRPAAKDIYWMIGDARVNGSTTTGSPDPTDQSLQQTNTVTYQFSKGHQGDNVECVVLPQYGNSVSANVSVGLGYGPSGTPTIITNDHFQENKVDLTCIIKPADNGNPPEYIYTWKQNGGYKEETTINTLTVTDDGNYTCLARNEYGQTSESASVEILLAGPAPSEGGSSVAIIAGSVGAAVLIIAVIVAMGIVCWFSRSRMGKTKEERPGFCHETQDTPAALQDMASRNDKEHNETDPENHVYNYIDQRKINNTRLPISENSKPNNNTLIIPSVYNNAMKGPPKKIEVHHYEPLRHNRENEESGQSRSEPRDGHVGPSYYNIGSNCKSGKLGFVNNAVQIDAGDVYQ